MIENLTQPKEPYFHLAIAEKLDFKKFYSICDSIKNKKFVVRFIEGNKCNTLDEFFSEFAKAFEFPDYFGHNWAAFDECLNSLDWLPSDAYLLLVSDIDQVMPELENSFKTLIEILTNSINEWTEGRNYDGFPTPPTPFHIVLQCSKDNLNEVKSRFKTVGLENINLINI